VNSWAIIVTVHFPKYPRLLADAFGLGEPAVGRGE